MASDGTIVLADEAGVVEKYRIVEQTGRAGRPKDAKGYSEPYVTVFQAALERASTEHGLTRTDLRVWMAALARAPYPAGPFDANPREMGAVLHLDPKLVSRTVTRLVGFGLLERPRVGKLQLPPEIAWRGTVLARETALKNRKEPA